MKKIIVLLLAYIPFVGFSQESAFQQELVGLLSYNESQIVMLAEAIPAEKYSWSPAQGVRSVSGVLMHIASANYGITAGMGFELPAGVDPTKLESITDKKKAIETVKASFAFLKEKAVLVKDANLSDKFKLPFGEFSKRQGLLILLDHAGEHKGQLIAYARSNGVVPPWSQAQKD